MIRSMHEEDFPQVYQLVKATDTLDVHTAYTYWVMSSISPELMLVAVEDGEISGFLGAFGPYRDKGTAFIWQLGVLPRRRGLRGMGMALLLAFHDRCSRLGFHRYVFTIARNYATPHRLLSMFAERLGTQLVESGETGSLSGHMKSEVIYIIQT